MWLYFCIIHSLVVVFNLSACPKLFQVKLGLHENAEVTVNWRSWIWILNAWVSS